MLPIVFNLFNQPQSGDANEQIHPLLKGEGFNLEHILSYGQATELGFWYDQPLPEWVALMRGRASLNFEGAGMLELSSGDYLIIPARSRHRVEYCTTDAVWLALHFKEQKTAAPK